MYVSLPLDDDLLIMGLVSFERRASRRGERADRVIHRCARRCDQLARRGAKGRMLIATDYEQEACSLHVMATLSMLSLNGLTDSSSISQLRSIVRCHCSHILRSRTCSFRVLPDVFLVDMSRSSVRNSSNISVRTLIIRSQTRQR